MISWEPEKTYGHIASIPTTSLQELTWSSQYWSLGPTMERLANARLIAAAPDLLSQVKEYRQLLVTLAMQGEETSLELEAVDQVIRKTEGEE